MINQQAERETAWANDTIRYLAMVKWKGITLPETAL